MDGVTTHDHTSFIKFIATKFLSSARCMANQAFSQHEQKTASQKALYLPGKVSPTYQ